MKSLLQLKELEKLPQAKVIIADSESSLDKISPPYFIKADIAEHKTEKKAVVKCNNLEEAKANFARLKKQFPKEKIIIQEAIEGIEMVLGLKQDKVFGKLLLLGFGGTNIEILKDITFLSNPTKQEILNALKSLKLYSSLTSRKKYATDKFIELAEKVSNLNLTELDLNPVILTEKQAVIVDARGE